MSDASLRVQSSRVDPDAFLGHYFQRIDPRVAASFSAEQRAAMVRMFGVRWREDHPVNIRRSVGFGRHRFYAVLVAGPERRDMARLRREGMLSPLVGLLFYGIVGFFVVSAVLLASYLVKSLLGVDLVPEGGFHAILRELGAQLRLMLGG